LIDVWGMLEELEDDGWLTENEMLVLRQSDIIKGWLTQNPRVAVVRTPYL
jgi:hypothetical protein